jgi:hypothetical protein
MSMGRAALWEKLLRDKLSTIRDESMTLQATLEFSVRGDVTRSPVWQFASNTVAEAERLLANQNGELSLPE